MKLSTKNQSRLSAAVLAGSTLIQFIYARSSNENTSTSNRSSNTSSSTSAATIGILSYVFTTMSNSSFVKLLVDKTNNLLLHSFVMDGDHQHHDDSTSALSSLLWTNEDMVLALMMCSLTLVGCQFVLRMVYKRKKAKLMKDLHEEREKVCFFVFSWVWVWGCVEGVVVRMLFFQSIFRGTKEQQNVLGRWLVQYTHGFPVTYSLSNLLPFSLSLFPQRPTSSKKN